MTPSLSAQPNTAHPLAHHTTNKKKRTTNQYTLTNKEHAQKYQKTRARSHMMSPLKNKTNKTSPYLLPTKQETHTNPKNRERLQVM